MVECEIQPGFTLRRRFPESHYRFVNRLSIIEIMGLGYSFPAIIKFLPINRIYSTHYSHQYQ